MFKKELEKRLEDTINFSQKIDQNIAELTAARQQLEGRKTCLQELLQLDAEQAAVVDKEKKQIN